ncbi:hypothetical protein MTP04_14180 [Lysinibacillus sp. PLM2]|nr:hypothetical protein MTP04_14180 [Lysinibacillus sp. PLM2]
MPEWKWYSEEKGTLGDESARMELKLGPKGNFRRRKFPNGNGNRRKRELWELKVPEWN